MEPVPPGLSGTLREIVGPDQVLVDDDLTERYRVDWTRRYRAASTVVARPGSTAEAAAVVAACATHGTAVVPQGGNTGLVAGAVPLDGGVVVSTERLAAVEEVDARTGHVTAGAGAPLAAVQRAAEANGWRYAVDIASRDTATIGGTVATNAGGLRVLGLGDTRRQVTGVEVVTGQGRVVTALRGTLRDNTGVHLPSLLCGSEGSLGLITRVRVRLVPPAPYRTTVLAAFTSDAAAASAAEELRRLLPAAESVELVSGACLELVGRTFAVPAPFPAPAGGYVLAETAAQADDTAVVAEAFDAVEDVVDVAVATDAAARVRLWQHRDRITEAIATVGVAHKLDVAVPPGALAELVTAAPRLVAGLAPEARTWLFGHGGEGAVHVNVTGLAPDDDTVDAAVLGLVADLGGSISAEHGIGRAKRPWLALARSGDELDLMAALKGALDPLGVLNPGVLVPAT